MARWDPDTYYTTFPLRLTDCFCDPTEPGYGNPWCPDHGTTPISTECRYGYEEACNGVVRTRARKKPAGCHHVSHVAKF